MCDHFRPLLTCLMIKENSEVSKDCALCKGLEQKTLKGAEKCLNFKGRDFPLTIFNLPVPFTGREVSFCLWSLILPTVMLVILNDLLSEGTGKAVYYHFTQCVL